MKQDATPTVTANEDALIHLDPAIILADSNIRFAMGQSDIDQMKEDIRKIGYVSSPVEVEEIEEPGQFSYRLTTGFRRHAAVAQMNEQEGAGLTLPAIVRSTDGDAALRLLHQLSENLDRKNLSPMDTAVAIKGLLDAGKSKTEVRNLFPSRGGKKGEKLQPASNAWVNMMLSFLEMPKTVQAQIHSGILGVAASYELSKASPEKRATILERAQEKRQEEVDRDAAEETKFLESQKKVETLVKEGEKLVTDLDEAAAEVELSDRAVEKLNDDLAAANKLARATKKGEERKKAEEHYKALELDFKGLERKQTDAHKKLEALKTQKDKNADKVADMRARLDNARKAKKPGKGKGASVSPADIKASRKEAGEKPTDTKLTAAEMRKVISDLTLAGTYEKCKIIGTAILACFDGTTSAGTMLKIMAQVTGEFEERKGNGNGDAPAGKKAKR